MSPFKNEKTPSFTVNDEKGFYHCFSTAEHGNIFDFLMKTQNLKFGEAVKTLANLAGMKPYTFSKLDEKREKELQIYLSIYSDYINFYHDELFNNPEAKQAKDYLKSRNLSAEDVKKFKIGFVKSRPNIYESLIKKFDEESLKESGIFYYDEKKKIFVERFRDRIIFPINSITGQAIGIGGRIIKKILRSQNTSILQKQNFLKRK